MEDENTTLESLDGTLDIDASSDDKTVETVPPSDTVEALSLEELNKYLGKNYKDKETALKSLRDTFSYVGKKIEKKEVDMNNFISKDQYETDMFYSKNPEYEKSEIRAVIDSMAKSEGKRPAEIVQSDTFKSIFGKVKGYEESQNLKSVLETNPRLASSKDKLSQAGEAMKAGNKSLAADLATKAVMEAYE